MNAVLIVEDSATQAAAVGMMLEDAGFTVRTAGSIEAALSALDRESFDTVLLDLELPDATGLGGLERLVDAYPMVPVVVLTSHGREIALEALHRGAEDYLLKEQLDSSILERAIRYGIERHRSRNELTALTEELREKAAELIQLNRQKDHIMGVVAHDLRNPLGVVRGYADFLLSGVAGELDHEQIEILGIMRRSSQYMLHLVEELVDFSRIQAGAMELEREPTDLTALIREAIRVNQMLAQEKKIAFEAELDPGLPEIALDRHKIRQLLDNLFSNAVKFSHAGSRVDVELAREGEAVHLLVRDRGVGIPAADLPRVFAPFQRTSARPTAGERSTGLGLAIVCNIVKAHGGRIWVESVVGEGSTFHTVLPLGDEPVDPSTPGCC